MFWNLLPAFGGIGLFLVGMLLMTDGLKALAGARLRDVLSKFTSTPLTGAVTGAVTTAAIQSSSATTVAAVGFVASGLLTFPQALGIIFGANIGTTMTGWLVALLGFKLDLGQAMLPVVFVGALFALSGRKAVSNFGLALAGFSLVFIGIEQLKSGLDAFRGVVTPADFPPDTLLGRLKLVLIGVLITMVTQSSSAGVATALAALSAGAVSFPQAAALVIGMDVGTTFTAVLATLGGGTMARRTGSAHVIYNVMTGVMAFFLLGPFTSVFVSGAGAQNSLTALVAFHSFFNALGVVLILPFAKPFARFVEALIPDRGAELTKSLDPLVLGLPEIAVDAAKASVDQIVLAEVAHLRSCMGVRLPGETDYGRDSIETALAEARAYLDKIEPSRESDVEISRIKGMYHILDHLDRLLYRCSQVDRISELPKDRRLKRLALVVIAATDSYLKIYDQEECENTLNRVRRFLRRQRKLRRDLLISDAATDSLPDEVVWARLDSLRWMHRVSYHLWRIRWHLNALEGASFGGKRGEVHAEAAKSEVDAD
ncbi:Na/Pi cotransporter family protein [Ruegeria sp. HKCCA6837]|uniref:Na/Pi cotransporter family protein n=1 Tax=Ruegeria sp. HKCCA6837 TaxID=2682989 RepID=UPI0014878623|nr:Na/Pi symporter [Ruegeria sp. HKCCA6837]